MGGYYCRSGFYGIWFVGKREGGDIIVIWGGGGLLYQRMLLLLKSGILAEGRVGLIDYVPRGSGRDRRGRRDSSTAEVGG